MKQSQPVNQFRAKIGPGVLLLSITSVATKAQAYFSKLNPDSLNNIKIQISNNQGGSLFEVPSDAYQTYAFLFSDTNLLFEVPKQQGLWSGIYYGYYPNGHLKSVRNYILGMEGGICINYFEGGQTESHGFQYSRHLKTDSIAIEKGTDPMTGESFTPTYCIDHVILKNGRWFTYSTNGQPIRKGIWKNGALETTVDLQ